MSWSTFELRFLSETSNTAKRPEFFGTTPVDGREEKVREGKIGKAWEDDRADEETEEIDGRGKVMEGKEGREENEEEVEGKEGKENRENADDERGGGKWKETECAEEGTEKEVEEDR